MKATGSFFPWTDAMLEPAKPDVRETRNPLGNHMPTDCAFHNPPTQPWRCNPHVRPGCNLGEPEGDTAALCTRFVLNPARRRIINQRRGFRLKVHA
jgi:hypothetical protein